MMFYQIINNAFEQSSLYYVLRKGFIFVWYKIFIIFNYYTIFGLTNKLPKFFKFEGKQYPYFRHKYNNTWLNERAIEIPLIMEKIDLTHNSKILEVGNVLSNYFNFDHDILDKYDKSSCVINEDVVNFKPNTKYDLIVCISTIEHVGWDEKERDPNKIIKTIKNLKRCLKNSGKIIFTFPFGYNDYLDKLIKDNKLPYSEIFYFKRVSRNNIWIQTQWSEICNSKYNAFFPYANALIILTI